MHCVPVCVCVCVCVCVWSDDKLWPWQEQVQLEIYASQAAVLHPAIAAPFGTTVHPLALINASRFPSLRARAWTNATSSALSLLDASSSGSACGFLVLVNTDETAPELFQLELTSAPPTAANDSAAVRLFDAGYTKPLMRSTDGTGSGDDTGSTGGGNKLLEDWVGPGEVNIYLLGSPTACARLKTDDGSNEPPPATTATTTASSVVDVGTAEHLLLWGDSALTANTTLVAKTHPPTKTGIMAVVPDKPWERLIYMFNTIVKVNETDYRIYYDAFGLSTDGSRTGGRFTCVALSTDGTTYTKPSLGLVMFMNSTDNNIIGVVGPGSPTVTPLGGRQWGSVFIDTNPKTPHRFVLVGHDVFASEDGFAWTLLSAGHIPFSDTQTAVYFDPVTSNYSIYYRTHSLGAVHQGRGGCPGKAQISGGHGDAFGGDAPTRSIGLFVTPNLTSQSWGAGDLIKEDPDLVDIVLKADAGDQPCMDLYTSAAVRVADATFLFPMRYLHCNEGRSNATPGHPVSAPVPCTVGAVGNDGLLDVGFAASRDGRTAFERFDRAPFLPRGMGQPRTGCPTESGAVGVCRGVWEGAHDAGSTNIAVGTMDRGDETLMVGGGYQYTHGGWVKFREPGGPVRSGLQLLTLRRHGFVSLRPRTPAAPAEQPVGTLRTQLLRLPTCGTAEQLALELNLDTAVSGFATVAVESPGRPPLRSIELVGNSVHFEVQFAKYVDNWNNSAHALPTDLQGAVVRLSFQLTGNADLYGFQLQCRHQQFKPRPVKTDDRSTSKSKSTTGRLKTVDGSNEPPPAEAPPPPPCPEARQQQLLHEFCRIPTIACDCHVGGPEKQCPAGWHAPLWDWVALKSGPSPVKWRCYAPSALNANRTAYKSGREYCSGDGRILQVLKTCKLPPPPAPAPVPPGQAVFSPAMVLNSSGEVIHTFRIPSLLRIGQTKTLLGFAEGRKFSPHDFGPKALVCRRSTDLGVSWGALTAVVNRGNSSFMNPNAIWDNVTQSVILHFTYISCGNCYTCCPDKFLGRAAPSTFQIVSTDAGLTWGAPMSLDAQLGVPGLLMGPGIGIQLPPTLTVAGLAAAGGGGRLLAMGRGYATDDSFSGHDVVIASDDNGQHWRTTTIFNGTDGEHLDEPQLALLPNGHVLANMRRDPASACHCRAVSTSTDAGATFGPVTDDPTLISPTCQGEILAGQTSVWFSNPANKHERADFTVRRSTDNAKTWTSKLVSPLAGCGYSSMQFIDDEEEEATVGFLWESDSECTIRFVPVSIQ